MLSPKLGGVKMGTTNFSRELCGKVLAACFFLLSLSVSANICNRTPGIQEAIRDDLERLTGTQFNCHEVDSNELSMVENIKAPRSNLGNLKPEDLAGLISLQHLSLAGNSLTSFPEGIEALTNLKVIDFFWNQISGPLPSYLGKLKKLERIYLAGNQLSGPLPSDWSELPNLERIILNSNQLSGPLPVEYVKLKKLDTLFLSHNQLSGPLPPEYSEFANLREVELIGNQFSGSLPPSWSKIKSLVTLFLYDNQLSGPLPPSWGTLENLRYLHLSDNWSSDSVPSSWSQLNLECFSPSWLSSNRSNCPIP